MARSLDYVKVDSRCRKKGSQRLSYKIDTCHGLPFHRLINKFWHRALVICFKLFRPKIKALPRSINEMSVNG